MLEESFPGEGKQNGCETFVIKKGEYWSELLTDWRKDESIVGKTFQKLLRHPDLDKSGNALPSRCQPIGQLRLPNHKCFAHKNVLLQIARDLPGQEHIRRNLEM